MSISKKELLINEAIREKEIRVIDPEVTIWQRSFHDHVIRNQAGYDKIWLYIENNPVKWVEDCFYNNN